MIKSAVSSLSLLAGTSDLDGVTGICYAYRRLFHTCLAIDVTDFPALSQDLHFGHDV